MCTILLNLLKLFFNRFSCYRTIFDTLKMTVKLQTIYLYNIYYYIVNCITYIIYFINCNTYIGKYYIYICYNIYIICVNIRYESEDPISLEYKDQRKKPRLLRFLNSHILMVCLYLRDIRCTVIH